VGKINKMFLNMGGDMENHERLVFILNLLVNNTNEVDLYKQQLSEFVRDDIDFKFRINNILELLKVE